MEDVRLVLDLVLALGAACLGGLIARRLGQPVLLGYVVAGALIGENTPGLSADFDRVQLLATLGAAFLMFALGVEFSFNELELEAPESAPAPAEPGPSYSRFPHSSAAVSASPASRRSYFLPPRPVPPLCLARGNRYPESPLHVRGFCPGSQFEGSHEGCRKL